MKAFIAGATGYTGRAVVKQLRERGVEVVAHVRPDSSRLQEWTQTFEGMGATVDSAAWDEASMTQTLAAVQPDLVFCLIGTTRSRARSSEDPASESYMAVDYGLTAVLVNACVAAQIAPKFIYLSSLGVSESSPSAYLQARYKAEQAVIASGLDYVIARPSFISGDNREESRPGERVATILGDAAMNLLAGVGLKGPLNRYGSLNNEELAAGLLRFALDDGARGVVVEAADLR